MNTTNARNPQQDKTEVPRLALSIGDAAQALGVGQRTVEAAISEGRLPVVRFGRRIVLPVETLRTWLASEARTEAADVLEVDD